MSLLQTVREQVSRECFSNRCRKEGCLVSLSGAPESRVIVDCDCPRAPIDPDQQHCDYLVFAIADAGADWVIPMELKRGRLNVGIAVRQLQGGACTAESLVPQNMDVRFRPIAVCRGIHRQQERQLRQLRVRFNGRDVAVRLLRCGARLADALTS